MGERSGYFVRDRLDVLRDRLLKASLAAMKALNRLPFVKLDKQIANVAGYLGFEARDTHFTFATLTEKAKAPVGFEAKKAIH